MVIPITESAERIGRANGDEPFRLVHVPTSVAAHPSRSLRSFALLSDDLFVQSAVGCRADPQSAGVLHAGTKTGRDDFAPREWESFSHVTVCSFWDWLRRREAPPFGVRPPRRAV